MNRLILAAAIVLSGYAMALAQSDPKEVTPSVSLASIEVDDQNPLDRTKGGRTTPEVWVKWSNPRLQEATALSAQWLRTEPSFVWINGALYSVMGSGLRTPVPGGGASGCFTLGLPERIEKVERFLERLTEGKQTRQKLPQLL